MPQSNMKKIKKIRKLAGLALRDTKEKTVSIEVMNIKVHPLYKRRYLKTRKYLVQTEIEVKKGQRVVIQESRPLSRKKSWQVVKVINSKDGK